MSEDADLTTRNQTSSTQRVRNELISYMQGAAVQVVVVNDDMESAGDACVQQQRQGNIVAAGRAYASSSGMLQQIHGNVAADSPCGSSGGMVQQMQGNVAAGSACGCGMVQQMQGNVAVGSACCSSGGVEQ